MSNITDITVGQLIKLTSPELRRLYAEMDNKLPPKKRCVDYNKEEWEAFNIKQIITIELNSRGGAFNRSICSDHTIYYDFCGYAGGN